MSFKVLTFLFLISSFALPGLEVAAQNLAPVNVILTPEISDRYAERAVFGAVRATISNHSALYHQVEREDYEAILGERKAAAQRKDDPYVATVLKGAAVGILFTIKEYTEVWDSVLVSEVVYGRDYDYTLTLRCVFNLKIVDVATSEVIDNKQFTVTGSPVKVKKPFAELQKHTMRINALSYLRKGVSKATGRFLLQAINPAIPVLKFIKGGEGGQFLLAGGKGVYPGGTKFRLIRESRIQVNGKAVLRQETVGEGRVTKNQVAYSSCSIISLQQGVTTADLAMYVLPSADNEVPAEWNEKPTSQQ